MSASLEKRIDDFTASALRIKQERDDYEAALRDIILGCNMMQQPALNLTGAFAGFVAEVKRVAQGALEP